MKPALGFVVITVAGMLSIGSSVHANSVQALYREHGPAGQTVITVVFRSPVAEGSYRTYRLEDPARAVLALEDVTDAMEPDELNVGDRHVERLRMIHHPERTPQELLLVFDLATDSADILEIRRNDERLTVFVALAPGSSPNDGAGMAVSPTLPPPTSTPVAVATLTPTPSPTQTHRPPSPVPVYADRPAPPVVPPISRPAAATPTAATSHSQIDETPTPDPDPKTASRVVDVTVSDRTDGSTLVRITADGRIPQGRARFIEIAGEPPRVVVTVRGLSAPDLPRSMEIDEPGIDRIRLIHDAETIDGELHIVLHLAGPRARVETMQQVGPHLVVLLVPAD
ncbi:MAG: hypothetical protein AB1Z65_03675 [Candidatus Sulfomarinibacteraceae bacterium]